MSFSLFPGKKKKNVIKKLKYSELWREFLITAVESRYEEGLCNKKIHISTHHAEILKFNMDKLFIRV